MKTDNQPVSIDRALLEAFMLIFDVWEEAQPFISMMVEADEMELVVALGSQALMSEQVAEVLDIEHLAAQGRLERAYARCIVNKVVEDGISRYTPANYYARLDHFGKYENWDDIPPENRNIINRRSLDEFIKKVNLGVTSKMSGQSGETALPNDTVMLLHEVEEMIDAAEDIVLQPCDCRRLGQNCEKPVETCLSLDNAAREALDRGYGRQLSKDEAKDIVRNADKKGLMHTADSAWREHSMHAICNCCACDCYPFLAAQELGTKGVWPKSHYIAEYQEVLCSSCGACVKRCHFDAFYLTGETVSVNGKLKGQVAFEPEKCWGCGLCANTCPPGAIKMKRLSR